jgi:hypothetical protein
MKKFAGVLTALIAIAMAAPAFGWSDSGHKLVAAIAYYDLGPARAKKVADILRKHPDYALWMREKPANVPEDPYLFMRAAVWPDDIRGNDHPSHGEHKGTWHYATAWIPLPANTPVPPLEAGEHIQQGVAKSLDTLKGNGPAKQKAIAICWLFHLIGDIQMPLHAGSLVTPVFNRGDQGGNLFYVKVGGRATKLHSYWDGLLSRDVAKVGTDDVDDAKVLKVAQSLRGQFQRGNLQELQTKKFEGNVLESRKLAYENGYLEGRLLGAKTPEQAFAVPPSYDTQSHALAQRRVSLGGYRLADNLVSTLHL